MGALDPVGTLPVRIDTVAVPAHCRAVSSLLLAAEGGGEGLVPGRVRRRLKKEHSDACTAPTRSARRIRI